MGKASAGTMQDFLPLAQNAFDHQVFAICQEFGRDFVKAGFGDGELARVYVEELLQNAQPNVLLKIRNTGR